MEIIVHQAILHVLDTTLDAPVLSGSCMEMTAEKTAYLQYHIEKLLASDDIRQCRPLPDSAFRYELEQNKDFIDLSCRIAGIEYLYTCFIPLFSCNGSTPLYSLLGISFLLCYFSA